MSNEWCLVIFEEKNKFRAFFEYCAVLKITSKGKKNSVQWVLRLRFPLIGYCDTQKKNKNKKNLFLCILVIIAKTKAFYAISTCVTYWDFGDHFGFLHIDVIFYLWWTSVRCFVIVYSIKVLFFKNGFWRPM